MPLIPRLVRSVAAALCLLIAVPSQADARSWDQVANIKSAATKLSDLQQARGAAGTYEFIAACYKTHSLASEFSEFLESCLVQDYIHSNVTAAIYSRLTKEQRAELRVPEPEQLTGSMSQRVIRAYQQYKLPQAKADDLVKQIEKHGMPVFTKARFPEAANRNKPQ